MEPLPPDPYKALGVEKDAELAAIKTAYRKLALKCHPDKVTDPQQKAIKQKEFYSVQQAYEILSDNTKRKEYEDQLKARSKFRDDAFTSTPSRPPPKSYYDPVHLNVNIRTAEPPSGFKAGPPPPQFTKSSSSGPYPYPQYSASWDRDIPTHSKPVYEDERKARRAASYEKPQPRREEDPREERRRRREEEERVRREPEVIINERREKKRLEKEREKEQQKKEYDREQRKLREKRERQLEEEAREAREKEAVKEAKKTKRREADKDRDKLRRQAQDEKTSRVKKAPYVEEDSDDDHRSSKKKVSASVRKHVSPPRRERSARRDPSPEPSSADNQTPVKTENKMMAAADYMRNRRRKGSKPDSSPYSPDPGFSNHFPDPQQWRQPVDKYQERIQVEEPEIIDARPPPPLAKAYTSPIGTMHSAAVPNISAPRIPPLNRASTMDYKPNSRAVPVVPAAPEPRHSHRAERRRRASYDDDYDEPSPRTTRQVRYPINEESTPRVSHRYVDTDEYYGHGRSGFPKVKVANYDTDKVYHSRSYGADDVAYTTYTSQQYPEYVR